jgi:integrase/ribosomal protein L40E
LDFLWHLLENFDFEFSQLNQEKVEKILIWLNQEDWKDWTKYSYGRILKNFLSWLNEKYNLKLNLKNVRVQNPKNSLMPEYLITEEEFNKLFNATDDLQTRLIIGLLYESGCRIGEILSLKIQNVSFNQYGARLIVKGKTGQRVVPVVWFANLLKQFLESHPLKENPEANLFYYVNKKQEVIPLRYDTLRMRLIRLCKKVGIKKKIHPHLFRHTRLTELAKQLPEQILKQVAGWVPDSKMAQTYIHLSFRDIEESLISKVYGIKVVENEEKVKFKVCPKCGELNPPNLKICQRCKTPLDEKQLIENILTEEQIKEFNDWAEIFLRFFKVVEKKYPDIWRETRKILKEKGKEDLLNSS